MENREEAKNHDHHQCVRHRNPAIITHVREGEKGMPLTVCVRVCVCWRGNGAIRRIWTLFHDSSGLLVFFLNCLTLFQLSSQSAESSRKRAEHRHSQRCNRIPEPGRPASHARAARQMAYNRKHDFLWLNIDFTPDTHTCMAPYEGPRKGVRGRRHGTWKEVAPHRNTGGVCVT